jgi:subtilisin family serine protease
MAGKVAGSTGRWLAVLRRDTDLTTIRNQLADDAGIKTFEVGHRSGELLDQGAEIAVLERLRIAVISSLADLSQMQRVQTSLSGSGLILQPEMWRYALVQDSFIEGFRAGVNQLADSVGGRGRPHLPSNGFAPLRQFDDTVHATWGLQAIGATACSRRGQGIKVAVLDTGFDDSHPDFRGRDIQTQSFVPGESSEDGHGHGTHCIGTACGDSDGNGRRYGIASEASIFAGKVLSNSGGGRDAWILDGIEEALNEGCHIISMSLGRSVIVGERHDPVYENLAASEPETLFIAAAGNDSSRPWRTWPISSPANCPSFMAVGAVGPNLDLAGFSNGQVPGGDGSIDIVAPGVDVYSAWITPFDHRTINGTSMATPHVAGVAALFAEATDLRGQDLRRLIRESARPVPGLSAADAGSGLVQAP